MNENLIRNYKIFISGEQIDLCIPDISAIDLDGWADWFNDISENQNSNHGIFPNSYNNQVKFLESLNTKKEIVLLICTKANREAVGVISLQNIDMGSRRAFWSIMIGRKDKLILPGFVALEAVALLTEHGFTQVGLQRIHGAQPFPALKGWNKLLELIGYQTDGIHRNDFRRGNTFSNTAHISCLYDDYVSIIKNRKYFWPGIIEIKKLTRKQPSKSYADKLDKLILNLKKEHFSYIFKV